ncbi:MAG: RDD family protein [Ardenticatenales bacterium]|nr:RDD family protein [Ardenticatenales bacterium]
MSYSFIDQAALENPEQTVHVVGLGRRFVAYMIDFLILTLIGGCIGGLMGFMDASTLEVTTPNGELNELYFFVQCLSFVVGVLYFVLSWGTGGQTLGKMAMGIKVIRTDGSPVGIGSAFVRYIGYIISGLAITLGFAWIGIDERRQGWHDKLAGTYVVPKNTHFSADYPITFDRTETVPSGVLIALYYGLFCLIPFFVIALLTVLGPQIGEVFSEVTRDLPQR